MPVTLECPSCGKQNELHRVFCSGCGKQLDLKSVKPDRFAAEKKGGSKAFFRFVQLAILLALLWVGGMALWPQPPVQLDPTRQALEAFEQKVTVLENALKGNYGAGQIFNEQEVNTYLDRALTQTREALKADGQSFNVRATTVSFASEEIVLLMYVQVGPIVMSYELAGSLDPAREGIGWETRQARIGHLEAPGPLVEMVEQKFSRLFEALEREHYLLSQAEEVILSQNSIELTVGM